MRRLKVSALLAAAACAAVACGVSDAPSPHFDASPKLDNWKDGPAKSAIEDFVGRVTRSDGPEFVRPAERIAVFDNDGTLWAEQPMYFQLAFALDRVKQLAPQHPEWRSKQPFKGILEGNPKALEAGGERGIQEVMAAAHAGVTTDEFSAIVKEWIRTATHPTLKRPYTEVVYRPMLELLAYLRSNGFKTYIVSGGGLEFMRPWVEEVYGIPPEQVIGSRIKVEYQMHDGKSQLFRMPAIDLVDDHSGKVVGIHQVIGRRPIAAFGNSDGDYEMLEWTTSGSGARLGVIVHHTDAAREWAYDRESSIGKLARALDEAPARHWVVVDMAKDWTRVFDKPAR